MLASRSIVRVICLLSLATASACAHVQLARGGATLYRIVRPDRLSRVDEYAIRTLTDYLRQITGANFPVVDAGELPAGVPAVFVGPSARAVMRLGADPLSRLKEQEYGARTLGPDIFLYGKGVH